jgi:hypothetical protein
MYWSNLEPIAQHWYVLVLLLALAVAAIVAMRRFSRQPYKGHIEREKRRRVEVIRWHARARAFRFLNRLRMPRLTDQSNRAD